MQPWTLFVCSKQDPITFLDIISADFHLLQKLCFFSISVPTINLNDFFPGIQ